MSDDGQGEQVVALANYVRLRDPARAEVAFAVADALQGQGVGTRLLEQLAATAAAEGISTFVAEVMPDNAPMLGVFADAGFAVSRRLEGGTTEVRLEIAPTDQYRAAVDERDHLAVAASLAPFFAPKTVAVIGASTRRGSIGGELFRNILDSDFDGIVHPVNPKAPSVAGVRAYASVADIPDPVDLAVFCVPGASVLDEAEAAMRKGTRALCVISAGFAETGVEGMRRQEQLLARVRAHGARLIGPNCLGIFVGRPGPERDLRTRTTSPAGTSASRRRAARSGWPSSSGAPREGSGLSAFVSVGNKADVSSNDLLEYWEDDPATDLILLYLESFGNPRKFARLAQRVARKKPILAMKGGRTTAGQRAAGSHTAALAGSTAAVEALFRAGRRDPGRLPGGAVGRRRAALVAAASTGSAGGAAHERRAVSASSAPTPARRPAWSCRRSRRRRAPGWPTSCRARRASPIPSTCSARPWARPTRQSCRTSWPTPASTP